MSHQGDHNSLQHALSVTVFVKSHSRSPILHYCMNVFNFKLPTVFINVSAFISPFGKYLKRTTPSTISCSVKWYIISIFSLRRFTDIFYEILIAPWLSVCILVSSFKPFAFYRPFSNRRIHTVSMNPAHKRTFSASDDDNINHSCLYTLQRFSATPILIKHPLRDFLPSEYVGYSILPYTTHTLINLQLRLTIILPKNL